MLTFSF